MNSSSQFMICFQQGLDKCASSLCCECCQSILIDDTKYTMVINILSDGLRKCDAICNSCLDINHMIQFKKNIKCLERLTNKIRPTFSWKNLPNEISYHIIEFLDDDTRLSLYSNTGGENSCSIESLLEYYRSNFINIGKQHHPSWRASAMSILRNSHIISQCWLNSVKSYENVINKIFSPHLPASFIRVLLWKCKRWFMFFNMGKIMRKKKVLKVYNSNYRFIKNI